MMVDMTENKAQSPPSQVDILNRWPSRQILSEELEVGIQTIHHWYKSNNIPGGYEQALLESARRLRVKFNLYELAQARHVKRLEKQRENT